MSFLLQKLLRKLNSCGKTIPSIAFHTVQVKHKRLGNEALITQTKTDEKVGKLELNINSRKQSRKVKFDFFQITAENTKHFTYFSFGTTIENVSFF